MHIDLDAFFAQVEERENPHFRGKPVVVGADPMHGTGRGVVSTANYVARKYGICSAMPISEAWRRCVDAIFIPVNMHLYQSVSNNVMGVIEAYSQLVEKVSVDEAYLDVSHTGGYKQAESLAKQLKAKIVEKEQLTSTIGVGPNKLIAKIACRRAKPNGLLVIEPNQVEKFLEPLDVRELPGIGPKTAAALKEIKICTVKELKKISRTKLEDLFGKAGKGIYYKARGIDEAPIVQEEIIKSIGKEHTFAQDTRDPEVIFTVFEDIISKVHKELVEQDFSFKTVTTICRFAGFETHTKSKTLEKAVCNIGVLNREAKRLLLRCIMENLKLIRLIGLRVKIEK